MMERPGSGARGIDPTEGPYAVALVLKADIRPARIGELDGTVQRRESAVDRLASC